MEFVQRRKLEYSSGPKTSSRDIESHRDVEKCARDSRRPHNPRHQTDNLSALGILIGIILVLVSTPDITFIVAVPSVNKHCSLYKVAIINTIQTTSLAIGICLDDHQLAVLLQWIQA